MFALFCLIIGIFPPSLVFPGPLKGNGAPTRLIALLLLALVLLGFFVIRRSTEYEVSPGVLLIASYFVLRFSTFAMGLSTPASERVEAATTRTLITVLADVGIALYAMTRIKTPAQHSFVLGFLSAGLTFCCIHGFLQNFMHLDIRYMLQPPFLVQWEPINEATGQFWRASLADRNGATRAVGTTSHPIEFSVLASITVPLNLHLARFAVTRRGRVLAGFATVAALMAVPAGVARSGVIALVAAMLVYMWSFKLKQLAVGFGAVAAVVALEAVVAPNTLYALWLTIVNSQEDQSVLDRVSDYANVAKTFRQFPVFGVGLGGSMPSGDRGALDNEWLQAIVQGGLVGLTAMIVLTLGGVFGLAAAIRSARTPRERDEAFALGAMFIGIMASSTTFDLLAFRQAPLVLFLTLGLLWSTTTLSLPSPSGRFLAGKQMRVSR